MAVDDADETMREEFEEEIRVGTLTTTLYPIFVVYTGSTVGCRFFEMNHN